MTDMEKMTEAVGRYNDAMRSLAPLFQAIGVAARELTVVANRTTVALWPYLPRHVRRRVSKERAIRAHYARVKARKETR